MGAMDLARERKQLETVLQELGEKMGIGAVKLDEGGVARLLFDGATVLDLQYFRESSALGMMISVQELPDDCDASILRALLAAPLGSGHLTPGVFPTLDQQSGEVLLMRVLPLAGLSADSLAAAMETLLLCAEAWHKNGLPETASSVLDEDMAVYAISI